MAGLLAGYPVAAQASPQAPAAAQPPPPVYLNTSYPPAVRAADLVSRMTLAEKVQQLRTNSAPAIPRLGVQEYTYWNEGQHGLNTLFNDTNNGGATGGVHATSFPTNNGGKLNQTVSIYYQGIPLQSGKTVKYVTLPNVSQQAVQGSTAMHVFAAAIGG